MEQGEYRGLGGWGWGSRGSRGMGTFREGLGQVFVGISSLKHIRMK